MIEPQEGRNITFRQGEPLQLEIKHKVELSFGFDVVLVALFIVLICVGNCS